MKCQQNSRAEEATMAKDKTRQSKPEGPEDKAQDLKTEESKQEVVQSL